MEFANAPKDIDPEVWDHPTDCSPEGCVGDQLSPSTIFVAEVCILRKVCTNSDALFKLEVGEPYMCDFDRSAFMDLMFSLQAS